MIEVVDLLIDEDIILAKVISNDSNPKWEDYHVSYDEGVYLCTCHDFIFHGNFVEHFHNRLNGVKSEQYKCKHIKALEKHLANN